ncbi:MAG: hypothetical protein WAM59_16890, partial [Candidatus Acidiferrales bacterium]
MTGNPIRFDTLDNLHGKLFVFFGAGGLGRETENGFFVGWTFFETNVLADARFEKGFAEDGANLLVGVARNVGAAIEERDNHAEDFQ